jgi:hypothetical protein
MPAERGAPVTAGVMSAAICCFAIVGPAVWRRVRPEQSFPLSAASPYRGAPCAGEPWSARRARGSRRARAVKAGAPAHQPQVRPSFCFFSHSCSGAKYSSMAVASICRSPVTSASASGQGRDAPSAIIAWSFCPASLLP